MKTKIILLLMLLLFTQAVCADRILILNLHYDKGKVSVIDKIDTYGYAPDRKLQPDVGYRAEIVDADDNILYSFKFEVPLEHYTDIQQDGKLQGGMVLVDETDFALIVPSLAEAKQVNFYNERDQEVLSVDVTVEEGPSIIIPIIIGLVILILILVFIIVKKRKSQSAKVI